jgi:GNAT superfamily N-acetyltransferase
MRAQEFIVEYRLSARKNPKGVKVVATDDKGKQIGVAELEYYLPGPEYEKTIQARRLFVEPKYQRQGIAQAMYDLLKSRGYTIIRSGDQTFDGGKFWDKSRGKKGMVWEEQRAQEFIVEYKLSVSKDADGVAVKATAGGKSLGHAEFFFDEEGRLDPQTVWVDERYHSQGIARDMYDHLKDLGYTIVRSWDQTDAGRGFWNKHRGEDARVWEQELSEISRDRLERYLSRATRQVDSRQERMARARQRLNTSYEIYHADEPTKIVDRFEADTPADAQSYYQDYIERYESDVDYDLRLRRGTGIMEFAPSPERDNNDDVPDPVFVLANRWWNAAEKQPQIESVLNSMGWSIQQVESEDDAVQLQHRDGTTYFISADDFDPDVFENFADGKVKGKSRPGRVKRAGASCNGSVTDLRARAKNSSGEKAKMYHWCANMKSGRKKNK